ncbi:MAG: hypothetical protein ACR2PR_05785 [Pseudohongiellaceae bacterium]
MEYTEPSLLTAFREGSLSFAYGVSPWLFAAAVLLGIVLVWLGYLRTTKALSPGWKIWFITLRSTVLALVLFCLLRPVVTTSQITPQESYLGILFDSSESMTIADLPGRESRVQAMQEHFFNNGVMDTLAENFQLRSFRFDAGARRIADEHGLTEPGSASSIGQALDYVRSQLGGLPLAAVVLVSDGADNSEVDPLIAAREFGNRQVPVFTVGVGAEEIDQDIGVVDVSAAKTVLEGSVFTVQVALNQQGYGGRQVNLSIMDGDSVVVSEPVILEQDGITRHYELELTPQRQGLIVYQLNVELQEDEIIADNNSYQFLVDNTEKPPLDILYVEGHPRNEYKFIRRAVADDSTIRLAAYLQTGPEKYYRQGINSPTELAEGFPRDKESLYAYEAIILGDVEATFFNTEQLQMIEDFVAERGGGFLISGMVDEEFINTPVADILPLGLVTENFLPDTLRGGIRRGDHPTGELYYPRLTGSGEFSPLLRLAGDDATNLSRWRELPELQGVYASGRVKPGASVLLEHPFLQYQNQTLPVLATQRYGSGRSMALTTASTWRWQMMLPAADQSHETLWRQMLRWLAVSAPERVSIEFDREFYNVGDTVNVSARVLNDKYEPDSDATLWLQTTNPLDQITDAPMEWDIAEDGVYRSNFEAAQEGVYSLLVDVASAAGDAAADASEKRAAFVVTPSGREYINAEQDRGLLTRIAEASGGRYFNLATLGALPATLEFTPNPYSRQVQYDLWDQPWLLILLITLLCLDWVTRRMKGLS